MRGSSELPLGQLELVDHALGVEIAGMDAEDVAAGVDAVGNRRAVFVELK